MTNTKAKIRNSPRSSEDSRAAILEATREELAENGWRKFSVDKVSRKAKASKQTIYRWWPAIGNMCVEAALDLIPPVQNKGRDPAERIADLLAPFEKAIRNGSGHAVLRGAIMASCDDRDAGESWRNWQKENLRSPLRMLLAEIASKKVIRRDYDLEEALDLLLGPIWNRILIQRSPLPEGFGRIQGELLVRHLQA